MASTVSGTQILHKVVVSFLSLQQSGVVEISKFGFNSRSRMLPKLDVVNAQGSLNLDAKTRSISAPYPEHPQRITTLTFNTAMMSRILQVFDLQQHLYLGNAKYKFRPMLLRGSGE